MLVKFYTNGTCLVILLISLLASTQTTNRTSAHMLLKPCATEDSVMCYWNAQKQGNGQGQSFWTDRDGTVHYLTK